MQQTAGRNLVILCDGTGNELCGALASEIGSIRISNVLKLFAGGLRAGSEDCRHE